MKPNNKEFLTQNGVGKIEMEIIDIADEEPENVLVSQKLKLDGESEENGVNIAEIATERQETEIIDLVDKEPEQNSNAVNLKTEKNELVCGIGNSLGKPKIVIQRKNMEIIEIDDEDSEEEQSSKALNLKTEIEQINENVTESVNLVDEDLNEVQSQLNLKTESKEIISVKPEIEKESMEIIELGDEDFEKVQSSKELNVTEIVDLVDEDLDEVQSPKKLKLELNLKSEIKEEKSEDISKKADESKFRNV